MKKLIPFLLIVLLSSCTLTKLQRQSNRVARKIERLEKKYPEAFKITNTETLRIDTVIQRVEIAGEAHTDTVEIDRILKEIVKDTIKIPAIRVRLVEKAIPTIVKDTLGIRLSIRGTPQGLWYRVTRDPIHVEAEKSVDRITVTKTEVIRRPFWKDWKFWLLMVLLVLYQVFKDVIKIYLKSINPFK